MTTPRATHAPARATATAPAPAPARPSRALGTRLWHLRLARSPLHANTLARATRLPARSKVQPRLSAELISRSILKTPPGEKPEDLKT